MVLLLFKLPCKTLIIYGLLIKNNIIKYNILIFLILLKNDNENENSNCLLKIILEFSQKQFSSVP